MNRRNMGIFLAIYGIVGGQFGTFISYFVYYGLDPLKALFVFFNPLAFMMTPSTFNIVVIGTYPFAMIALGLYLIVSYKKKPRR